MNSQTETLILHIIMIIALHFGNKYMLKGNRDNKSDMEINSGLNTMEQNQNKFYSKYFNIQAKALNWFKWMFVFSFVLQIIKLLLK